MAGGTGANSTGGGGGSGHVNTSLTNTLTVSQGQAGFVANPVATGNGFARITLLEVATPAQSESESQYTESEETENTPEVNNENEEPIENEEYVDGATEEAGEEIDTEELAKKPETRHFITAKIFDHRLVI